jgi:uncharacterized protein
VRDRRLPVLLEESLENTLFFLDELAQEVPVIIPHLGGLNGGYVALDRAGVWRRPQVYADTAVAARPEIKDFIRRFGTDHPFGSPVAELNKIFSLELPDDQTRSILGDNFRRLCHLV